MLAFGVLFYINRKEKDDNESTPKTNFVKIKWVSVTLISTPSIDEIKYNIVKPFIHDWLLRLDNENRFISIQPIPLCRKRKVGSPVLLIC
jgi:hypothetical protein